MRSSTICSAIAPGRSPLTRVFGPEHLPLAEEVVQEALIAAMQQWSFGSIPRIRRLAVPRRAQPGSRPAPPQCDAARKGAGPRRGIGPSVDPDEPSLAHELVDDQLR